MPRPRFQNLAEDKRLAIIEAAAKEFAQFGYENASINRILELAGMSKGAAYYYFDDKADVFMTAVQYYTQELTGIFGSDLAEATAENFWTILKRLYVAQIMGNLAEPWRYGVLRAIFTLSEGSRENAALNAYFAQFLEALSQPIEMGQALGVIRTDLPQSLLLNLLTGFDTTVDSWFIQNGASYSDEECRALLEKVADSLQALLGT